MAELKQMNVDQICDMLKNNCDKYYDTQSVVNWKYMNVDNLDMCRVRLLFLEVFKYFQPKIQRFVNYI